MENLESTSLDSLWMSGSIESNKEQNEKQRDAYKKAQAQLQRVQKDEKKAQQDDKKLFTILTQFIQNPYYTSIIPDVTELLVISTPSRCVLSIISLLYPDAAMLVCQAIGKNESIHLLKSLHKYPQKWKFVESDLHKSIRDWMSFWIFSMDIYLTDNQTSVIMQKKLETIIEAHADSFDRSIVQVLRFFFESRNIDIANNTLQSYAVFIRKNIYTSTQKALDIHPDKDIAEKENPTNTTSLFGLE